MTESFNSFLFSTPEMTLAFSRQAQLRAMMRFEWALNCALEKHGLASPGSSNVMEAMLDGGFLDLDLLGREATSSGNIVIPFVRQLTSAVKARDEAASRAIHLGATSQDVLDSALVLQMREGFESVEEALGRLEAALVKQIRQHRDTVLTGRTWLQPGPPTTLGLKLAGTLSALRRDRERVEAVMHRALVLQLGGAVGTLAALGDAGSAVSAELARILDLREPELPWHTHRDRFVETVQVLATLTGSLAKFARDMALLMQAEVGEASEGTSNERGGSSTMPHKRNPVDCAAALAAHARMPGLAATMLYAMPQEHERGLGLWQAEWDTVPEAFRVAGAALAYSCELAEQLEVDGARMQANFDALLGVTLSEAVSAALAGKTGRYAAHALLTAAVNRAREEKMHLRDVLKQTPEVLQHLTAGEIDALMNPRAYLGSAQRFIANVLGEKHGDD
jgi:3-carboxy-cis,cis-muconate cycloisomerase